MNVTLRAPGFALCATLSLVFTFFFAPAIPANAQTMAFRQAVAEAAALELLDGLRLRLVALLALAAQVALAQALELVRRDGEHTAQPE